MGKTNDMIENNIYLVKKDNVVELDTDQVAVETIGAKAFGLCQIPTAWSVPFFVISKELFEEYVLYANKNTLKKYIENIKLTIEYLGIEKHIILRSSAVNEGMDERGRFDSIETNVDNLENALIELLNKLKDIPNRGMPIIVQKFISPYFKGHMSNERRLSQESRDWKIETYYDDSDSFEQDTIGIRTWRTKYDITEITSNTLTSNPKNIINVLHKVAFYWYKLSNDTKCRFHLEFVFDGQTIYIVQADCDFQKEGTINPKSYDIRQKQLPGLWTPKILKKFNPNEQSIFAKLQNVKDYSDLGFCTVPLYFLDDITTLSKLNVGIVSEELKEDIETLLSIQSVVIRLDISHSDKSKKQMLPRSNELRNYNDVVVWLKKNVNIILIEQKGIFIFHNFVPATSSAFAHALPNNRIVKIQSLWGLPEGLYYNYHDTIIVDLGSKNLDKITESDVKVTVKNKYKDLFICPNEDGKWVACRIKEPYDWKCSIEKNESILEIAVKSQKLANKLQKEISVMWFVGIDNSFYGANNLPWFHENVSFSSYTIDEYKRKYFIEEEIIINNSEELQSMISSSNVKNIRCFRLKPNCEKDLRNKELIINIGQIAAKNDIMILLDGAQLTHSYYQLKKTGAKVVCSDKDELLYSDTLEFNKLVRDKIPEKIISNGEHVRCTIVERPVFDRMLLEKLLEEAYEVNDAKTIDDLISELADLTEICNTITKLNAEYPVSCCDILNNKKFFYLNEFNELMTYKFPNTASKHMKTFRIQTLYGSISIHRKKTFYRIEFNLQNYPIPDNEKEISEKEDQFQKLKTAIISDVSLALNCKNSKDLINYINKINYHVTCLCKTMSISIEKVKTKRQLKALKVGGFEKGYVLCQTTLKDNVIDDTFEFNPANCEKFRSIERENNRYFDFLQNFEKNQKRLLFRFSLPIAVNEWQIFFSNPKMRQLLTSAKIVQFYVNKNNAGNLTLTVNVQSIKSDKQLYFFEL